MPPKKVHYHVNAIGGNTYVREVIVRDQASASIELASMVNFLRDVTGSWVTEQTEDTVHLSDGTKVRYKACSNVCLID